jgi:hypothetical protein
LQRGNNFSFKFFQILSLFWLFAHIRRYTESTPCYDKRDKQDIHQAKAARIGNQGAILPPAPARMQAE